MRLAKQLHKNRSFYILYHEIQVCLLFLKNEDNLNNKNGRGVLTLFPLIMPIALLQQDNANLFFTLIINRIICFSQFELIFEIQAGHTSFSSI